MESYSVLDSIRYFDNNLDINETPKESFDSVITKKLFEELKKWEKNNSNPLSVITSKMSVRNDLSMYIGSSGYLYMYYRLYEYSKRANNEELKG